MIFYNLKNKNDDRKNSSSISFNGMCQSTYLLSIKSILCYLLRQIKKILDIDVVFCISSIR